jgi:hypothetical protein
LFENITPPGYSPLFFPFYFRGPLTWPNTHLLFPSKWISFWIFGGFTLEKGKLWFFLSFSFPFCDFEIQ